MVIRRCNRPHITCNYYHEVLEENEAQKAR
jgi:hypothetical protein